MTYRLSGLPARAAVEVVRLTAAEQSKGSPSHYRSVVTSPSHRSPVFLFSFIPLEVSIGLQLTDGSRVVGKFPPSASLWDILLYAEKVLINSFDLVISLVSLIT